MTQSVTIKEQVISVDTVVSGQIRIANAGNAVRGPDVYGSNGFYIKAHPDNTDTGWMGNDGADDITNANGYPLDPGEQIIAAVGNLNELWFDGDVAGVKFCWHKA
jgi:hypothetical protein